MVSIQVILSLSTATVRLGSINFSYTNDTNTVVEELFILENGIAGVINVHPDRYRDHNLRFHDHGFSHRHKCHCSSAAFKIQTRNRKVLLKPMLECSGQEIFAELLQELYIGPPFSAPKSSLPQSQFPAVCSI